MVTELYLHDLLRSLARRWYLALAMLLATLAVCAFAASSIPPTYDASASVVLIPPKSTEDPHANRLLSLGGLNQANDLIARAIDADRMHAKLLKQVPGAEYEVVSDWTTSAPILIITTNGASPSATLGLLKALVHEIPLTVENVQASLSIESESRITVLPLSQDTKSHTVQKARIRAVTALAAACVLMGATTIGLLDGLLLRRKRRRSTPSEEVASPVPIGRSPETGKKKASTRSRQRANVGN